MNADIAVLCIIAGVSRSGYYHWLHTADQPDKDYDDYLTIKQVFDQSKGKYGWRSIKMRLPHMNHKKIQRIMRKYELKAKIRRKNPYKMAMKKNMEHRIAPNKLDRGFKQCIPRKVFCTDITYIPFRDTFAYLAVIKDIATGEVVAWNLRLNLEMSLVMEPLMRLNLSPDDRVIIHSDQGFHYTNPHYISMIKDLNMEQSMSRKGNCIDNAPIESFFGHMKDELDTHSCKTFRHLSLKITEYMQYYNYERKQWTRNKMAPVEYREHLLSQLGGG